MSAEQPACLLKSLVDGIVHGLPHACALLSDCLPDCLHACLLVPQGPLAEGGLIFVLKSGSTGQNTKWLKVRVMGHWGLAFQVTLALRKMIA